jgi:hypothetical protein
VLLRTYDHKTVLDLYYRLYNTLVADKELDERDIATLGDVQQAGGLTNEEVRFEELIRPYSYVSAIRTEGELPAIHLTVDGAGPVILRKGEVVHYAHEATLNEIKRVSLGYSGGSHGGGDTYNGNGPITYAGWSGCSNFKLFRSDFPTFSHQITIMTERGSVSLHVPLDNDTKTYHTYFIDSGTGQFANVIGGRGYFSILLSTSFLSR